MITGSHVVIFTQDAAADRAFFGDVMGMPAVDAGGGWLIFALPPTELGCHPADENSTHALYLMCDDLAATVEEMERRGAHCDEPSEQSWGIATMIHLPGAAAWASTSPTIRRRSSARAHGAGLSGARS